MYKLISMQIYLLNFLIDVRANWSWSASARALLLNEYMYIAHSVASTSSCSSLLLYDFLTVSSFTLLIIKTNFQKKIGLDWWRFIVSSYLLIYEVYRSTQREHMDDIDPLCTSKCVHAYVPLHTHTPSKLRRVELKVRALETFSGGFHKLINLSIFHSAL